MPRTLSPPRINAGLATQTEPAIALSSVDPFRIVLLGDFGGRASRNEPRLRRDPILVHATNFETVLEELSTGLEITVDDVPLSLRFGKLDDFHPDHIYTTLPLFQPLRRARQELANPAAFRAAAPEATPPPSTGALLDQIMGGASTDAERPTSDRGTAIDQAIRRIIAPYVIPKADARHSELMAQVDAAAGALMRGILNHPEFQALEAAWRSVFFLLRRLKTGDEIKLYVIDVTREEMVDATSSGAPQLIARDTWSAAACLHSFGPSEEDFATLASLAGLARKCGGPLLAGMHPSLVGCRSIAATPDPGDWKEPDESTLRAWKQLRAHPDASWIGLAMPRILFRLPYGRDTSPAENFAFEEMPQPPDHDAYLWGSPAVACVCLLGQAFQARGWRMYPGLQNRIDGLAVHNYRIDGEPAMTPGAETWLTDYAADEILKAGIMPLASSRSTDAVLLVRSQSIADPPGPLAGPWGSSY